MGEVDGVSGDVEGRGKRREAGLAPGGGRKGRKDGPTRERRGQIEIEGVGIVAWQDAGEERMGMEEGIGRVGEGEGEAECR